ncbi:MAG: hypothetical protein ABJB97_10110 [Acidobacteriota bacterium]
MTTGSMKQFADGLREAQIRALTIYTTAKQQGEPVRGKVHAIAPSLRPGDLICHSS